MINPTNIVTDVYVPTKIQCAVLYEISSQMLNEGMRTLGAWDEEGSNF